MTPVRFYVVRHGSAEPGPAPGGDARRRLTAAGRTRFAEHARALAPALGLARIRCSPLARARETADLLAAATGAPVEEEAALASGASTGSEVLRLGRTLGQGAALVGHNPELAEAIALAARRAVRVESGAVAAIDADASGFTLAWLRAPG